MTDQKTPEEKLAVLMHRLRNLRLADIPKIDGELTLSQMEMIGFIAQSQGCRIQDIADGLEITPPTVSVAIRRLEEAGWLARKPDPEDGRAAIISLTAKSMKTMKKVMEAQREGVRQFLIGLDEEEKNQLVSLLEKAIINAENRKTERN